MGVSDIHRLGEVQGQLFDEEQRGKRARIDEVGDLVRERFGSESLRRGSTLEHEVRHRPPPRPENEAD